MIKMVIGFLMLMMSSAVLAGEGDKRIAVERLLEAMQAERMVSAMYAQVDQMYIQIGRKLGVTPEEQPIFDRYMGRVGAAMRKDMSWEKMKEPMIDIYLKHYTMKEIDDLTAFYNSESGKSMTKKMPLVIRDSMGVSQSMLENFMPKLKDLSSDLQTELRLKRRNQK